MVFKWYCALALPHKGTQDPWNARIVATMISRAGFARVCLRSDTEASMIALRRAVALQLTARFGIAVVPEGASVGDSSGNGLAEHAVREIKAKTRSLAHAVVRLLGARLPVNHAALPWLVAWSVMTINMGRRGLDGKTAWER